MVQFEEETRLLLLVSSLESIESALVIIFPVFLSGNVQWHLAEIRLGGREREKNLFFAEQEIRIVPFRSFYLPSFRVFRFLSLPSLTPFLAS